MQARREAAEALAKPYDPHTTPETRASFMQIQTMINHIDRAIIDEKD